MFANRYFAPRYFPDRYFGEGTGAAVVDGDYFADRYFATPYFAPRYFGGTPHAVTPADPGAATEWMQRARRRRGR